MPFWAQWWQTSLGVVAFVPRRSKTLGRDLGSGVLFLVVRLTVILRLVGLLDMFGGDGGLFGVRVPEGDACPLG